MFRTYRKFTFLSLFAAAALFAQKPFQNGQAARAVVGQFNFTKGDQNPTGQVLGGAGGVAWAGNRLFVADSNRLGATPNNSRVLTFDTTLIPGPYTDITTFSPVQGLTSCFLCGTPASAQLGQNTFTPPTYTPSGQSTTVTAFYSGKDGGQDQPGSVPAENAFLYNATAVASDGVRFAVADTDNNRVLLWNSIPAGNQHPDLVVGQPNFNTLQAQQLGVVTPTSMRGPQGVWIANNKLYVADTQDHRILIWNSWPTKNNQTPDVVLGQPDFTHAIAPPPSTTPPTASATALLNPTSVTADGGHVYVSDLGFNRVLIWNTISPSMDQPADVVIGQIDFKQTTSNNPTVCVYPGTSNALTLGLQGQCQASLNFPRFALSDGKRLFIADGGNDRVLIFNKIPTTNGVLADNVLGQTNFTNDIVTSVAISIVSTQVDNTGGVDTTPSPTSLAWDGTNLYVADPFNRRVLLFTPADSLIPSAFDTSASVIPVVNWGSEIVRQEATIVISIASGGKIAAGDVVTVTIAGKTPAYTYTLKSTDTVDKIAKELVAIINKSDQNVSATFGGAGTATIYLSSLNKSGAEVTSLGYDTLSLSATASNTNNLTITTSGSYLSAGNAATASPGMLIEVNAPPGIFFTDQISTTYIAPMDGSAVATSKYGVQLYVDGIASPLYRISPKQLVGQIPFAFGDRNSTSIYVRTVHADGSITITSATPVYIAPANPGIFNAQQYPGQTRPWPISLARHRAGNPIAVVSVDGSPTLNDTVSVFVNGTEYKYTVTASDVATTTLLSTVNGLINLMQNDPLVIPSAGGAFARLVLTARAGAFDSPSGNGIAISTGTGTVSAGTSSCSVTSTATETLTPYGSTGSDSLCHPVVNTCCAVAANTLIFPGNPAVPGEYISVYAAGLGALQDQAGNNITIGTNTTPPTPIGVPFAGIPFPGNGVTTYNDVLAANFVAATIGTSSAQVISAGLENNSYGLYRVDVQVPVTAASNPQTPFYIAQNAFISNSVYLPIGNAVSNPPAPPPVVPVSPINLSIDAPLTAGYAAVTTVSGNMPILGWAIDGSSPVTNVAIQIDGSTVVNLTKANGYYGLPRPDVCKTYPTVFDCPNVGYGYSFDTTQLANGAHTLQVLVTDAAGRNHTNPQGVNLFVNNDPLASHTHVTIDTPTTYGQIYHGVVLFNGWATNDTSAIVPGSFKASIDGFPIAASDIKYGMARPDVCAVAVAGTPGCPNVGWTYMADLTKLPNSNATVGTTAPHTFAITAVAANGQLFTVSSVFFVNNYSPIDLFNGPAITIDAPGPKAGTLSGTAQLFGWALDSYTTINGVQYSIDGVPMGNIMYGLGRPDVCAAYSGLPSFNLSTCPYVGFTGSFDTTQIPDGTHVLGITATPLQGQPYTLTRSIVIANLSTTANPVRIGIDSPSQSASTLTALTGTATIMGWSVTDSPSTATIQSVAVSVDGLPVGNAVYGDARPDVCATYPGRPGCPNVGFHFALDTTHFTSGTHVLEITSTTSDGKRASSSASFTVSNTSATAKTVIDTPNPSSIPFSGIVIASGWALKTGVAVNTVNITVDGVPLGSTSVNLSRADVCATYTTPNCPNVGWTYFFDTNALVDGTHILGVTGVAADGTVNTTSTTFTVQNWTAGFPISGAIDTPNAAAPYYTGKVTFSGWLLEPNVALKNVSVAVDGIPFGNAARNSRSDVCSSNSSPDCPNVGWNFVVDTSLLTNDVHTLAVTGTTAGGQSVTLTQTFTAEN